MVSINRGHCNVPTINSIPFHSTDGVKHSIRTYTGSYAVFSILEIIFTDVTESLASYQCYGNNSQGSTEDSVEIYILGESIIQAAWSDLNQFKLTLYNLIYSFIFQSGLQQICQTIFTHPIKRLSLIHISEPTRPY